MFIENYSSSGSEIDFCENCFCQSTLLVFTQMLNLWDLLTASFVHEIILSGFEIDIVKYLLSAHHLYVQ